jgi:hypothetical protein
MFHETIMNQTPSHNDLKTLDFPMKYGLFEISSPSYFLYPVSGQPQLDRLVWATIG